ncbi:hypothetical protein BLM14_23715 (plasmid) [Phyllobacterium zundukense]|nr:hypothetical protein BLM14_23715 [Phyllobacterium zundukense]
MLAGRPSRSITGVLELCEPGGHLIDGLRIPLAQSWVAAREEKTAATLLARLCPHLLKLQGLLLCATVIFL